MLERSTKRMPLKATRDGTTVRPPYDCDCAGGNINSMNDKLCIKIRGFAMPFRAVKPTLDLDFEKRCERLVAY
jgi:hypothetical protein